MGPWYIRDEASPFLPGCSLQTLRALIRRGKVTRDTVLRGPSTRQFWTFARNTPGIANLLGECHACHADAKPADSVCGSCGASFAVIEDRERLGLSEVRLLPGQAAPEQIAAASGTPGPASPSGSRAPAAAPAASSIEHYPHDAQTLIASSQRRKRARQRMTIAVAIACIAMAAVGATVAYVLLKTNQNGKPAKSDVPTQPAAQTPAEPLPKPAPEAERETPPAPSDDAVIAPQDADDSALIEGLTSGDPEVAAAALQGLGEEERRSTPERRAAVEVAELRLRIHRLGSRL